MINLTYEHCDNVCKQFVAMLKEVPEDKIDWQYIMPLIDYLIATMARPQAFQSVDQAGLKCGPEYKTKLKGCLKAFKYLAVNWGEPPVQLPMPGLVISTTMPPSRSANALVTSQPGPSTILLDREPEPSVQIRLEPVQMAKGLPDQGSGRFIDNPRDLIKSHYGTLKGMCAYAVGDASNFDASAPVIELEQKFRKNMLRCQYAHQAEQAVGGTLHFSQAILLSVYNLTNKAQAAVCTTFACVAAHVLTDGKRQSGTVRIEIIGVRRGYAGLATHCFCVCGRIGNKLHDLSTWGSNAYLVDIWVGAKALDPKQMICRASVDDWRLENPENLTQFYDNARPDPEADELAPKTNTTAGVLQGNKSREVDRLIDELKATPAFLHVKIKDLEGKLDGLDPNWRNRR